MGKKTRGGKGKKGENTSSKKPKQKIDIKEEKPENNKKDNQNENDKDSLKLVQKKVAISYKKLKENHVKRVENKDINNLPLESLKTIASNFDLDPSINFRLLSLLKEKSISEYNKYITKYKYTLNYEDAKKLNCFNDNEKEIKNECFKNFNENIDKIKSLSKLKIFNFLFYIINLKYDYWTIVEEYEEIGRKIKNEIELYDNELDLVFKAPNSLGNYELKYYTYLGLFIDYFRRKIVIEKEKNDNEINFNDTIENLEPDKNEIYFDWDNNKNNAEFEEVDMSVFEEKKTNLKNFIDEYLKENLKNNDNNIDMEIEEGNPDKKNKAISINKKDEDYNDINNKSEMNIVRDFLQIHVKKLRIYKSELYYLFKQDNDEKIIKDIEFIYYNLLFRDGKTNNEIYDSYANCLYNDLTIQDENNYKLFEKKVNEKIKNSINKDELVFANLDMDLETIKDNPFCNRTKYYKYPKNIGKNIFKENEKLFKNFMKKIFQSPLLEEIFYLTPEFNDFKYPLKDDEILNEMIDNTIFVPFFDKTLDGYTQKLFGKVYISNNLFSKQYNKGDISEIIIKISLTLNTMIHEQLKHYLKALLFYNSFRYKINKRLNSDLTGYLQESFFIDNIRKIYFPNKEINFKPIIDGGYRAEIYLYGCVLKELSFTEAIKMYKIIPWNLSVLEHLKEFNDNNIKIKKIEIVKLEDIKNNKELNDFIKEVFYQFSKLYKVDEIKIDYNKMGSAKSKDDLINLDSKQLLINYSACLERNIIKEPDSEIDKRFLYLYKMIDDY